MGESDRTQAGRVVAGTRHPVDATTVVLLRDGDNGLEVFLLERHIESDFAGGAYVFPGGKVDDQDAALPPERYRGVQPARVRDGLGAASDAHAVALLVAGVRESFEEAGPLLATRSDGTPVSGADLASDSFATARRRLATRGEHWDWRGWLEQEDLVLDLGLVAPLARWATPHGLHRRFDARFVAAAVPGDQADALGHDDIETTNSAWRTPGAALAAAAEGRATIIFPTRKVLASLEEYATAADVVAAGHAGRTDMRRILPVIVRVDGTVQVAHPDGGPPEVA